MSVVFVLNGPRRVGKDTAAEAIVYWLRRGDVTIERIGPKDLDVAKHYGLDPATADFYAQFKDEELEGLAGLSWRQLQIGYGDAMREKYGQDYFAKLWIERVTALFTLGICSAVVMPNCRFQFELDAALACTPRTFLYRLYRNSKMDRDTSAWDGDIGSWLFPPPLACPQGAFINDGTIDDLRYLAGSWAHTFYHWAPSTSRPEFKAPRADRWHRAPATV